MKGGIALRNHSPFSKDVVMKSNLFLEEEKMRKITILVTVLALASVLLAACGQQSPPLAPSHRQLEPCHSQGDCLVTVEVDCRRRWCVAETTPVAPPVAGGERLQTIMDRGNLICGVHGTFQGFGFLDTAGAWTGFDVDFCRAWAAALFNDADAVEFRALSAQDRFTALQSGEVDVLSRNSTWSLHAMLNSV